MCLCFCYTSFTLDYNLNSETKMPRKISLQEAIEFCQKSFDEESDFDDSGLHETLHGEPNYKLLENEDEALAFEDDQSDDGDTLADEPVANRQFHRQHQKYAVSSITTSLVEVNYDMIDFDNLEVKEADVPLEKKDRLSPNKLTGPPQNPSKTYVKLHQTLYWTDQVSN